MQRDVENPKRAAKFADPQFRSRSSDSNELSGMQLFVRVEDLGRGGRAAAAVGDGRAGLAAKGGGTCVSCPWLRFGGS